eukprot:Gregarina_sp_Poly_1__9029@NODE_550_length_7561_cov_218_532826_g435_i0_p2_GENE_NODE_550_length_7561_cov_218_532826_g435_i0NODE_550_length_7561_cov_218_532826_g435_i0_p2_ORF_typecomplete_len605_score88_14KH_1/PF00013_29/1_7e06KH_1/PF00013_29/1_6KH_1/PF00013_29/4_9KH_1/PF00013_29/0_00012SLS/PF14611_6/0_1SLS/PF14611_6/1_9e02_NODE_550_length_7561_cov_218_532826_g435_i037025516
MSDEESSRGQKRELEDGEGDSNRRQRRRLDGEAGSSAAGSSSASSGRSRRLRRGAELERGIPKETPQESPAAREDDAESVASEKQASAISEPGGLSHTREWRKGVERLIISDADASFILGTGGRTKKKLARVSKTDLSVSRSDVSSETVLEIRGSPQSIERAKTYIGFVMQQRVGPVHLEDDVKARDDIVILDIPHGCVGYVTGHKGQGLRSVEEEFATLMFFTDVNRRKILSSEEETQNKVEKLVIFSPSERSRQGAVLKVMSAIEQKMPGHFTKGVEPVINETDSFGTDIVVVSSDDYSYALGKGGGTRKKLARASGAILEYIGEFAYIAGTLKQRERARKYLEWLCAQRVNTMDLTGIEERDDVVWIDVPMDCVAYLTGHKGQALRRMEEQTGTFIFLDSTSDKSAPTEKLFIFGETSSGRARARTLAQQRINDKQSGASQGIGRRYDYRGGDRDRDRERERDRGDRGDRDREWGRGDRDRRMLPAYPPSPSPSPPHRYSYRRSPSRTYRPSYRPEYDDIRPPRNRAPPADYHWDDRRYSPSRSFNQSPPRTGRLADERGHSPPPPGIRDAPIRDTDNRGVHYYEPPSSRYDSERRHRHRY